LAEFGGTRHLASSSESKELFVFRPRALTGKIHLNMGVQCSDPLPTNQTSQTRIKVSLSLRKEGLPCSTLFFLLFPNPLSANPICNDLINAESALEKEWDSN
jgi:hypothetical protein